MLDLNILVTNYNLERRIIYYIIVDLNNLTEESIFQLLTVSGEEKERLYKSAREIRNKYFGDNLQLRAVIEITANIIAIMRIILKDL